MNNSCSDPNEIALVASDNAIIMNAELWRNSHIYIAHTYNNTNMINTENAYANISEKLVIFRGRVSGRNISGKASRKNANERDSQIALVTRFSPGEIAFSFL